MTSDPIDSGMDPDDLALMSRIRKRDSGALEILFHRYHRLVFLVGIRICRHEADADALVVTIFLELWSKPEKFDPERGSLRTYLMLLSSSRATDRVRAVKRERDRRVESTIELDELPSTEELSQDPAMILAEQDSKIQVQRTLELLDDETRQVLQMSFLDGLTHPEVASSLGLPLGTVKSRIRRGLQRFREQWLSGCEDSRET